nr:MAG TPA: Molybdenum cofactor biosynthesis protein A barrel, LIGAND BINDING PROTEIN [Caudoviricetes sp.]
MILGEVYMNYLGKRMESDTNNFEVRFHLFNRCNLRCKFCSETDNGIRCDQKIDVEYIRSLPNQLVSNIEDILRNGKENIISVNIMGGELFSDDIPDEIFKEYENLIESTDRFLKSTGTITHPIKYLCTSNGVYHHIDRVISFLKKFNMDIKLSYDFFGRFSHNTQEALWWETCNQLIDHGIVVNVSMVLTKPNIESLMNNEIIFPPSIDIHTHDYIPRFDYKDYIISDDDLFEFYQYCIDHGDTRITVLNDYIRALQTKSTKQICCENTYDMIFNPSFKNKYGLDCMYQCDDIPSNLDFYYGTDVTKIGCFYNCLGDKRELGLQKRGCYCCEHYEYCPKMCWNKILFQHYELNECPIKRIYQYIERHPELLSGWRRS